ncbi:threonine ammonia-lyase [Hydrogenimonas thermophila]|uniref:Threonine dehydratase n=1 Tax=Hydrogenimonas thermophila TaxID=223786 RepID=A0A1I5SMY7_9BACT|nr:threonine ammonia-lyase [Hydrogenimonas thermophila]WOE71032.1 threonine ammonia-lyase [Hydrogenimonas thermophila]WOE73550.1 threonine ammonia-lyase [Hydrogenimonas thermophila]SFP72112.1 threonine dehydratase [Hydrogenimonas thermophila]
MITLKDIELAHERVAKVVSKTPFSYAPKLSKTTGYEVYLKKENLQNTGSFKLRGAFNKIASLSNSERAKGVVAASAGNHAQGVALAAEYFGIPATIVMPETTPLTKVDGVKSYGAEVVLSGMNYDEAYAYAVEYAKKNNRFFVHPFADEQVIAGQGTIALEIFDKCEKPDAILVPVGGGGLISGIALAVKAISPETKVIGVAASGAPAMKLSFDAKTPIDTTSVRTIADGIAVRDTSPVTLEYILKFVDNIVLVDDEEIANAILYLLEKQKLVVEGAGAVSVAALIHNKISLPKGAKVVSLLSGGNIDVTMLSVIIEKGLLKSYRKMKLVVTLVDKPGSLMKLTEILKNAQANIVQIGYDRTSLDLKFGDAYVSIGLETKGKSHQEEIKKLLHTHGYRFEEEH